MSGRSTHLRYVRLLNAALLAVLAVGAGAFAASSAPAQTLQERLSETEEKLSEVEEKEGVLTTDIAAASDRISSLQIEVADLRNKEAIAAEELARKQAELDDARARLVELRDRLQEAVKILENRLVAIYKTGEPDLLTVVLESDGFDDVAGAHRVHRAPRGPGLDDRRPRPRAAQRDAGTVVRVKEARDEIARRRGRSSEATRLALEDRTAELAAARAQQRDALGAVREQREAARGRPDRHL